MSSLPLELQAKLLRVVETHTSSALLPEGRPRRTAAVAPYTLEAADRNPAVEKMEKHCKVISDAADKVAVDNEKAADFHTLRGRELQGQ